ncbi:unnamed protein product [Clonostachys rosea]|uniref:Uncharacterized protein n=1 Tax=Bionectria ochroleuca TaxID=29856 RepID=A0ABY6V0K1_BIOOC|nr:unnamed protein product [Clonostachys rosea]
MVPALVIGKDDAVPRRLGNWYLSDKRELRFSNPLDETRFIAVAERYGRARGERYSFDRTKQAQDLYDSGVPGIYLVGNRKLWDEIILGSAQHSWLIGCLESFENIPDMRLSKKLRMAEGIENHPGRGGILGELRSDLQIAIDSTTVKHSKWLKQLSGWDIRFPDGKVLGSDKSEQSTIPLERLRTWSGDNRELFLVWEQTRNNHALKPPLLPGETTGIRMGKPIPKEVPTSVNSIQPLERGDALWLLSQFLDEYFPNGGGIWLGEKEFFPQGTDDVATFIE